VVETNNQIKTLKIIYKRKYEQGRITPELDHF